MPPATIRLKRKIGETPLDVLSMHASSRPCASHRRNSADQRQFSSATSMTGSVARPRQGFAFVGSETTRLFPRGRRTHCSWSKARTPSPWPHPFRHRPRPLCCQVTLTRVTTVQIRRCPLQISCRQWVQRDQEVPWQRPALLAAWPRRRGPPPRGSRRPIHDRCVDFV